MADSSISQLPSAVAITNADVLAIDQAGVTKKATIGQVVGEVAGQVGTFPPGINYAMGGHKFTGLGQGSVAGDSVPYEQVGPLSRLDEPQMAGFMNIADFTLSWNNTTRTLTITPVGVQFQFYANGILHTKTAVETITIPNVTGNYYFYYDALGILSVGTSFNNNFILIYSFLASVYWNATTGLAVPDANFERHQAAMPAQTHLYLHSTVGTAYDSYVGGLLPSVTADGDGSLAAHIEFSATPGAIWDDDVQEIISVKQLLDNIPILYRTGALGVWTFDETSPTMVRTTGSGRAAYNQLTGGAWQLTEVTDTQFLLMHLYAIPGFTKKWMMIMGQNQYATLTLASNAALTEITTIESIPLPEHKAIASFVIQTSNAYTNSVKSRVRVLDSGASFIDWRFAQVGGAGASGTGGNVVGPVGAVDGDIALFNGATGTLIKDGGTPAVVVAGAIHGTPGITSITDTSELTVWNSLTSALDKITYANFKTLMVALFGSSFAALAGSVSQVFSVALATLGTHAPRASQLIGRNLVVNGSCAIDQVNNGALQSPVVAITYPVDNVRYNGSVAGKFSAQQVTNKLNSLGAVNALTMSVLASYSPVATDYFFNVYPIEGVNLAKLQWGTANAFPVSLQFKVNASVAGTYSGAIKNAAATRAYPFSFTVAANTDTLITIPNIPGDTAGVWPTTNVAAATIHFDLGCGTNFKGTANAWAAGDIVGVTGATNLVAQVNGSTLSITDVQLEQGAFCTTFERKLYEQDLSECQRYLPCWNFTANGDRIIGSAANTTQCTFNLPLMVQPRVPLTGIAGTSVTTPSQLNVNHQGATAGACTSVSFSFAGNFSLLINTITTAGSPNITTDNGVWLYAPAGGQVYGTGARI